MALDRVGTRPARRAMALLLTACVAVGCASSRYEKLPPASSEPEPKPAPERNPDEKKGWTKEEKLLVTNAVMAGAVAFYGLAFWDYGENGFLTIDEGWFSQSTSYGGADKLGHAYAAYLTTLGLASLYENWGYERPKADLYGALSAMGAFTMIEVGDAFSHNGWSTEDVIADGVGVLFGYWRRRVPAVGRYLDYRVEYIPSETFINGDHSDIVSDYSGFKYLLALKLEGFEKLNKSPLAWFELHAGYYTRGFATGDSQYFDEKTRHLYFAIGLNVSRLFRKAGLRGLSKLFEFYQVPYTYVPFDWGLPQ